MTAAPQSSDIHPPVTRRLLARAELSPLPISPAQRDRARALALVRTEPYDLTASLSARVFAHARETPDACALSDQDRSLSYAELATAVQSLAAALRRQGVMPAQVVAVGGRRRLEWVVAFLAIDLAQAVYLPLDADWPRQRVTEVLRQSAAALFLAMDGDPASPLGRAAADAGCACLAIPADPADPAPAIFDGPGDGAVPEGPDPRYLLYTSGSTGVPKGAVIAHRGMINHLLCKVQDLGLSRRDRVAATAPMVFDISIWQMVAGLVSGGEVVVFSEADLQTAASLARAVGHYSITILEVVPTMMRLLLEDSGGREDASPLGGLRFLLSTGEELPPATARQWHDAFPAVPIVNAYGPTECSDDVTHHRIDRPSDDLRHLPIGTPVANTALYVLVEDGTEWRASEDGEQGQLFVGGAGVGLGYLGNPEATRAAFFQDPFPTSGTGVLYRTGDAVVRTDQGMLVYLGRVDRQVKVAGVRMELGEIEATLRQYPGMKACAVTVIKSRGPMALVARETSRGGDLAERNRLVGYVCGQDLQSADLREFLAGRLPLPMVPELFVNLPELPLSVNGKIDYKRLPPPGTTMAVRRGPFEPPRGAVEEAVAGQIGRLLEAAPVGRDDSFLTLGGDSLKAMALVAGLRILGYAVTVRDILIGETPKGIADRITSGDQRPDGNGRTESLPSPSPYRPLTPQQAGVYFHWRLAPDNPYYTYQGALLMRGPLDVARLASAWDALLAENPSLLARFIDRDGTACHEYPHWMAPLPPVRDLSAAPPQERERLFRQDAFQEAGHPFDLENAPALRLRSYRMGDREHRLLLTMHEILLDGWGANVLIRRLADLYAMGDCSEIRPDMDRRKLYDDYLVWESRRLDSPALAEAGDYWRGVLSGPLPVLDLPRDRPPGDGVPIRDGGPRTDTGEAGNSAEIRPAQTGIRRSGLPSYRAAILETVLDDAVMADVRTTCSRLGCTSFVVILASYALALTYFSGTDEVIVGAPIANRDAPEEIDVAAFLLNMLPLRCPVDLEATAGDFLKRTRDTVLAGVAASHYPFGWMLKALPGLARTTERTPVFQTMVNMLTYPMAPVETADVRWQFTELDTGYTKYDLALYAQAHDEQAILLQLAYQTDLFEASTIRRILDCTVAALTAMTRNPGVTLGAIDLLSAGDQSTLAAFSQGH